MPLRTGLAFTQKLFLQLLNEIGVLAMRGRDYA